jgi:hypothetical protein
MYVEGQMNLQTWVMNTQYVLKAAHIPQLCFKSKRMINSYKKEKIHLIPKIMSYANTQLGRSSSAIVINMIQGSVCSIEIREEVLTALYLSGSVYNQVLRLLFKKIPKWM